MTVVHAAATEAGAFCEPQIVRRRIERQKDTTIIRRGAGRRPIQSPWVLA